MTNNTLQRLSWSSFQAVYLQTGVPARFVILDSPKAEIIVEPATDRIALRILTREPASAIRTPSEIDARYLSIGSDRFLEVSITNRDLHHTFFDLIFAVRDYLAAGTGNAVTALNRALADYRQLTSIGGILSEQKIQGLFGELWVLRQLISLNGSVAVESWIGPLQQPHDFRYGTTELEVKTTASSQRKHRINGASQLIPSSGCNLYLVSIQAQPAGPNAGESVPELVEKISSALAYDGLQLEGFRERLRATGYRRDHEVHYTARWVLRSAVKAVQIDEKFPCITQTRLDELLGADSVRVTDMEYTLDVSHLGYEDGAEEFSRVFMIS